MTVTVWPAATNWSSSTPSQNVRDAALPTTSRIVATTATPLCSDRANLAEIRGETVRSAPMSPYGYNRRAGSGRHRQGDVDVASGELERVAGGHRVGGDRSAHPERASRARRPVRDVCVVLGAADAGPSHDVGVAHRVGVADRRRPGRLD